MKKDPISDWQKEHGYTSAAEDECVTVAIEAANAETDWEDETEIERAYYVGLERESGNEPDRF